MNISVVIPAFNEEKTLETTVTEVVEYLVTHKDDFEILIIDDGSSDGTREIAERLIKKNQNINPDNFW